MPTVQLTPSDDAYVAKDHPTTNYGSSTALVCTNYTSNRYRIPYLKFDISSLIGNQILNAKLWLYQDDNNPWAPYRGNVSAYKVADTTWLEGSITWNTKPATGALIDTTDCASSNTWYSWDLKTYLEELLAASSSDLSVALDRIYELAWSRFKSKEYGSFIPYLEVEYQPYSENLFAKFEVGQGSQDLKAEFTLRYDIANLQAAFEIRHSEDAELKALMNIVHVKSLLGKFKVRHTVPSWKTVDEQICTINPRYPWWSPDPLGRHQQRHSFIAYGLYWLFYHTDSEIYYRTSSDGSTWSSAVLVKTPASSGYYFALCFDGDYVHYTYGASYGVPLYYRKGEPKTDGSITWIAPEQIAVGANASWGWYYPNIAVDEDGYPFIFYNTVKSGSYYAPKVTKSSRNDGVWATDAGFPWEPVSTKTLFNAALVALSGGRMYLLLAESTSETSLKGRIWDGSAWSSETIGGSMRFSAVQEGSTIHAVHMRADTGKTYYLKRTDGSGWSSAEIYSPSGTNSPIISIDERGTLYLWWEVSDYLYLLRCIGETWETTASSFAGVPTIPYQQQDAPAQFLSTAYCLAYESQNTNWLRQLTREYWAPTLKGIFHVGQDSINLKASFRLTQEDIPAEFTIRRSASQELYSLFAVRQSSSTNLFAEVGIAHWIDLPCLLFVRQVYDFSHSKGIAFYWWGADVVEGDQMIDFQMWSPHGGWVAKFPDDSPGWRWVFLAFDEDDGGDATLREVDLGGTRPDRSEVIAILWTYYTYGMRRVDGISYWSLVDLKCTFNVRHTSTATQGNLPAEFELQASEDLHAEFVAGLVGFKDLKAEFYIEMVDVYSVTGSTGTQEITSESYEDVNDMEITINGVKANDEFILNASITVDPHFWNTGMSQYRVSPKLIYNIGGGNVDIPPIHTPTSFGPDMEIGWAAHLTAPSDGNYTFKMQMKVSDHDYPYYAKGNQRGIVITHVHKS